MSLAVILWNGQEVEGELLSSAEVDFEKMTWTFDITDRTRVAAGDYIAIRCKDLEALAAAGKPESEVTK